MIMRILLFALAMGGQVSGWSPTALFQQDVMLHSQRMAERLRGSSFSETITTGARTQVFSSTCFQRPTRSKGDLALLSMRRQGSFESEPIEDVAAGGKTKEMRTSTLVRLRTTRTAGGTTQVTVPRSSSSFVSPDWLSRAQLYFKPEGGVPVADAKVEDIQELLGGGMYQALFNWQCQYGPIYLLPSGPFSSFLVVGEPKCVQHILRAYGATYEKGMIAEQSSFLFGDGFPILEGEPWRVRRSAVGPGMHRKWIESLVETVFKPCTRNLLDKLHADSQGHTAVNIEALFSQLSLDIIGRAVFDFDFGALRADSPLIKATYTALKETEMRTTDLLPLWKLPAPLPALLSPRQREAQAAVRLIREVVDGLVADCKATAVGANGRDPSHEAVQASEGTEAPGNLAGKPGGQGSLLRMLLESREEVSSSQLRDDLVGLLVAGHETTSSVLTWTVLLLLENPEAHAKAVAEIDALPKDKDGLPRVTNIVKDAPYLMRVICESLRLFPQPPVYTRRAIAPDTLPTDHVQAQVRAGQDILISIYNLHRSPAVWRDPNRFWPERFAVIGVPDDQIPNESNTQGRFLPFGAGPRKCIGDQFALVESAVALALLLATSELEASKEHTVTITSGATIHTQNGFFVTAKPR